MKRHFFAFVAAVSLAAVPAASAPKEKVSKQILRLRAMTPADHAAKVSLEDDPMDFLATFSTKDSFQWKEGLFKQVWSDIFLRAFVEKSTGETKYQVYFHFFQLAQQWPNFSSVNYASPQGLQRAELQQIGSDVDCSTMTLYRMCAYSEHLVFSVPEELLRHYAGTYTPNGADGWALRFKAQAGDDGNIEILPGEIAGLLMRVDEYRAKLPTSGSK